MTNRSDEHTINAAPMKELFIFMLTRDIELEDAILDLVDNSVDGARRLRGSNATSDYSGLNVRLEVDETRLIVADNCGGIPVEVAENYAFRFGRHPDMDETPHSVGQFGVGMKRAFFKIGTEYLIESTTKTSRFTVPIELASWLDDPEWQFSFGELQLEASLGDDDTGTRITIEPLHESVAGRFALENFIIDLRENLASTHQPSLERGFGITVNGIPVQAEPSALLFGELLSPVNKQWTIAEPIGDIVIRIYAGLSDQEVRRAGWNVFCNGRQVLEENQDERTGWGAGDGRTIPRFHPQYRLFRGYVYLDSDKSALLPWNTTKTSLDADSSVYRSIREQMIISMRPIITFINRLDAERETDETALQDAVETAEPVELPDLEEVATFDAPSPARRPSLPPRERNFNYKKPTDIADRVRDSIGASSYREAGELTFDYYVQYELSEDA